MQRVTTISFPVELLREWREAVPDVPVSFALRTVIKNILRQSDVDNAMQFAMFGNLCGTKE